MISTKNVKYESILLPYIHYTPVRAYHLNDRYVLVEDGGVWDKQLEARALTLHPSSGPRFYSASRQGDEHLEQLIHPFKLSVAYGFWVVEKNGDRFIYRDGQAFCNLYHADEDVLKSASARIEPLSSYVNDLNLESALLDRSIDLCTGCNDRYPDHVDFHVCRSEIGRQLLSELTGMVARDTFTSPISEVRTRLLDCLTLVKVSDLTNELGYRLTPNVGPESERYFASSCQWYRG